MYFEGTRDMYMPLLPMLFMGTEADTLAKAEPGIEKKLPIYEKVSIKNKCLQSKLDIITKRIFF